MESDRESSKFYAFLAKPLFFRSRFVLALLVIPLVLSFTLPLWRVEMRAPQYPDGLRLDVYAHTIESGRGGRDLREINILNHYIGMRALDRQDLTDLDWIPFALGLVSILALRCAAVGDVRSLVDVTVLTLYAGAFAMIRFVYKLHGYGHNLNPDAPLRVAAFTPPIFGHDKVGDIETWAGPQPGAYLIAMFVAGIIGVLVHHLVVGRRQALGAKLASRDEPT